MSQPRAFPPISSGSERRFARALKLAIAALSCSMLIACAGGPERFSASTLPVGKGTGQPIGAMLFCAKHGDECITSEAPEMRVELTDAALQALRDVQFRVNRDIDPRAPLAVAWDYATNGSGSCVQYAMEKRRALLALGWPASSLRLATATTRQGVGHLVLIANTTGGDLVLDNLNRDVRSWDALPYRWGAVQQDGSLKHWAIAAAPGGGDGVGPLVVALAGPGAAPILRSAALPGPQMARLQDGAGDAKVMPSTVPPLAPTNSDNRAGLPATRS